MEHPVCQALSPMFINIILQAVPINYKVVIFQYKVKPRVLTTFTISLTAYLQCRQDQTSFYPSHLRDDHDTKYKNFWYTAEVAFAFNVSTAAKGFFKLLCLQFIHQDLCTDGRELNNRLKNVNMLRANRNLWRPIKGNHCILILHFINVLFTMQTQERQR